MKEFLIKILPLSVLMLLCSCSDSTVTEEPAMPEGRDHFITESMAAEIADEALIGFFGSRSDLRSPVCEALTVEGSRAADFVSDTLAYVFNYPDSSGFVVVSADDRVQPILAFSETGEFDIDCDPVQDIVMEGIVRYTASRLGADKFNQVQADISMIPPRLNIELKQGWPYNKYVREEHPGCPAGCVAIAAAYIMTSCKDSLTYHGVYYDFVEMNAAIAAGAKASGSQRYTYAEAVDAMAKIIYWIGKDARLQYNEEEGKASGYSSDAQRMLAANGYTVGLTFRYFDDWNVPLDWLIKGHMIQMSGEVTLPTQKGGHAWIVDGCIYPDSYYVDLQRTYFHCNWGWGGIDNGFYVAQVFQSYWDLESTGGTASAYLMFSILDEPGNKNDLDFDFE